MKSLSDEANIIRRLSRLAQASGLTIRKRGEGYQLHQGDRILAGERHPLDVKDIARELQKLHVLGRR